jgi:hypothetical protein
MKILNLMQAGDHSYGTISNPTAEPSQKLDNL